MKLLSDILKYRVFLTTDNTRWEVLIVNKKMLKLFGEAFLKTMIVILGIAIVIFAIYFMIQVFGGGNSNKKSEDDIQLETEDINNTDTASDTSDDTTEPASEEPATAEPISSVGHSIEVLNSTDTAGVAAGWQERLNGEGFTVTQIGNYETETLASSRIIVSQDGMGQDLVGYFNNATVEVGSISSGVEIQIIIGTEDIQ